jgi:hypothetical protein
LALKTGLENVEFSVRKIGTQRTAWVLEKEGAPAVASGQEVMPVQGADLMPRTAVCVDILDKNGAEWRVDTPQKGSDWQFTIKDAKELEKGRFQGRVAPRFIYRMAQSVNLLPFALGQHCAPVAVPAERGNGRKWQIYDEADIRRAGFVQTARRFRAINDALEKVGKGKVLQERIDERSKLTKQVFGNEGYLLLSGAGGKHICAACISMADAQDLIIDQTLYWQIFDNEIEAWYRVGMMNSYAMTEAISPFNPRGDFSERHVHTLPYRLMPPFDPANEDHLKIAEMAQELAKATQAIIDRDEYLNDPSRSLPARRLKLRKILAEVDNFQELEALCAVALGTTAFGHTDTKDDDD